MLRKSCLYLLLLLFSFGEGYGQDKHKIDSLKAAYETTSHDTTKLDILFALGDELILTNPDTVLIIEEKALELADKCLKNNSNHNEIEIMNFKESKAEALVNIGYIHGMLGNSKLHLKYSLDAMKILENLLSEKLDKNLKKDWRLLIITLGLSIIIKGILVSL